MSCGGDVSRGVSFDPTGLYHLRFFLLQKFRPEGTCKWFDVLV